MVLALAEEFPGRYAERLEKLSGRLIDGVSVLDSISLTPRLLDPSHSVALRLADQAGKLPEMYHAILTTRLTGGDDTDSETRIGFEFLRMLMMTFITWVLLTFMSIYIIPTIEVMFADFGVTVPTLALYLIEFSKVIPVITLFVLLLMSGYMLWNSSIGFHWLMSCFLPSRFGKSWRPASVRLRSLLALIPRLDLPMEHGLTTIVRCPGSYATKRRLANALKRMEKGQKHWDSLASERLISRREAKSLSACGSSRIEGWILDQFAEHRLRYVTDRRHALEQIFSFVNTLVIGIIVAWTAISMFLVISSLIENLA